MALFTPTNQKRLTNVSVVRLKKGGSRFELACYPNKILEQGELQLTEKERQFEKTNLYRDVAKIISERCVNPENNRSYTALEVVKQLRAAEGFKIAPAMMELAISIDRGAYDELKDDLSTLCVNVLRQGFTENGNFDLAVAVEPEKYGAIESLLHKKIKGRYCIEIIGSARHASSRLRTGDLPATTSLYQLPVSGGKCPSKTTSATPENVDDSSSSVSLSADKTLRQGRKDRKPQGQEVDEAGEQDVKVPPAEKSSRSRRQKHMRKKAARDDWPDNDD